ncbi:hypothetical protein [Allokutzneria sp. A3M-2-11 16]
MSGGQHVLTAAHCFLLPGHPRPAGARSSWASEQAQGCVRQGRR